MLRNKTLLCNTYNVNQRNEHSQCKKHKIRHFWCTTHMHGQECRSITQIFFLKEGDYLAYCGNIAASMSAIAIRK